MVVTRRVLWIGFFLIPVNAWWITQTEYIRYSDNVTTQSLFFNATSVLLLLVGVNALLRRVRPRAVFSASELIALYVVTVAASGLAGHDTLQILFTTIAYPVKRAAALSDGGATLLQSLPPHLVVSDPDALRALYAGRSSLYEAANLRPWLLPLGLWTVFVLLLVWTMLCLTALFRRPWENERLSYPITDLPLRIIDEERTFWRDRVLWVGLVIGATLQVVNLLHGLSPGSPALPPACRTTERNSCRGARRARSRSARTLLPTA